MAIQDDEWSHITDISERRKAQNRIAQRNYRSRQRMRIELAEAILLDLPHLKSAATQQRWNELSSASGSNSRSRKPDFFDTSYQPDSTASLFGVPGLEDFDSTSSPTNFDCIATAQNLVDAPTTATQTTMLAASPTETQHQTRMQLPTADASPQTKSSQIEQCLTPAGSQRHSHDSPSDVFTCLDDVNVGGLHTFQPYDLQRLTLDYQDSVDSPSLSTEASKSGSVASGSRLKELGPSSFIAGARDSVSIHNATPACTPLLSAVTRGNLEIARMLINNGCKVDAKSRSGKTALHLAVERGDTAAARTLLDLGADITILDESGMSVFHRAIIRDDIEQLRGLLKWCEEKSRQQPFEGLLERCVNIKDTQNRTLVHLTVFMENVEILKLLLQYGADVNE
ncbi:ankyrin repeat-containing domain protein [Colletotrichum navitas]|uniref:Ankyrin repeat-containing domain protein n=1 Tax=Colletotrichum navitas TaxID=681940 RepID=A0AAD8Q014_9PEZI|nr:ankyrin repeat-containing domain protein [Colletotrichum navitas]KAK1590724.1 ankyrin repeat-containing domain protein [Colletotrichum navitas]